MPSSALSGNTSGLATDTSPGLVGTGAQTFAGDKTLTGLTTAIGGIINTGLTGANATTVTTAGSLKVGEVLESTTTGANITTSVTTLVSKQASSAGIWLVYGQASYSHPTANSYIELNLTTVSGGAGTFGDNRIQFPVLTTGLGAYVGFGCMVKVFVLTSNQTIYLNCSVPSTNATGAVGARISLFRIQ